MSGFGKLDFAVFQQVFDIGFDVVKIGVARFFAPLLGHGGAVPQAADAFVLRETAVGIFGKHAGDFKNAYAVLLAV